MKKIAVMGANAARQKTLIFDRLCPGEVNRAVSMSEIPSGKGINFCRAARNWNRAEAVVIQFAGGDNGKYLVDAFNEGWVYGWREKGWRRGKDELKNPDLWLELYDLVKKHDVEFVWVKGHNGHDYNERCDKLATDFADSFGEK